MPALSLVVCLYRERDLLERLLRHAEGCYDDLVVVHDGVEQPEAANGEQKPEKTLACEPGWKSPEELSLEEPDAPPIELARDYAELPADAPLPTGYRLATGTPRPGSIHELVVNHGGRFYEGPRCFQQEPHWPFAWWAAKHDWILRLDADEFPELHLRKWLLRFRITPPPIVSGYLGIWPLWNGHKQIWRKRAPTRIVVFNRQKVEFFGMVEHSPAASEDDLVPLPLLIGHCPLRKSYGVVNLLLRKQAYRWRYVIACSLLGTPKDLPNWRQKQNAWPKHWEAIRHNPIRTSLKRGIATPLGQAVYETRRGSEFVLDAYLGTGLHQFLIALTFFFKRYGLI